MPSAFKPGQRVRSAPGFTDSNTAYTGTIRKRIWLSSREPMYEVRWDHESNVVQFVPTYYSANCFTTL